MHVTPRAIAAASVAALLATGAGAASADAATISVTTGCVIFTGIPTDAVLPVAGSGFTPGSIVAISTSTKAKPTPTPLTSVQADGAGNFFTVSAAARFNSQRTQDQHFNLIAAESAAPAATATTTFRQVRAGYSREPAPTRPQQMVVHIVRGFTEGAIVYAHFRHHGRTRKTRSLGRAKGACGIATKRMQVLPTKARLGLWTVFVDQSKRFSTGSRPQARLAFKVTLGAP